MPLAPKWLLFQKGVTPVRVAQVIDDLQSLWQTLPSVVSTQAEVYVLRCLYKLLHAVTKVLKIEGLISDGNPLISGIHVYLRLGYLIVGQRGCKLL